LGILGLVSTAGLLVYWLYEMYPDALNNRNVQIQLVSSVALLSYFVVVLANRGISRSFAIKAIIGWIGIGLALAFLYSMKDWFITPKPSHDIHSPDYLKKDFNSDNNLKNI